jgi:hypothetical protein
VGYTCSQISDREAQVRKIVAVLFVSLLFQTAQCAFADLAAIHSERLPQETAILAALDDAKQLEPYSHSWTQPWRFPIAKENVATRLGKDLAFLNLALKNHSDNAELLLVTGLVARYAYNLDVGGSHEIAINVLEQAQKLAPSDVRATWFRATLHCQTNELEAGADEFLAIESSHAWEQLPAAFWNDYLECAAVTNMPAHLLRAVDHLEKMHAPSTEIRDAVTDATRKRYDAFDPKRDYQPKTVWESANVGENTAFTSTSCGMRLRARGDWTINHLGLNGEGCVAYFSTGPYKATADDLNPSVLLVVKRPEGNETLQDFEKRFTKKGAFEPFTPVRCPAAACIAMKGVQPGMYKKDGDGHGRIVVFERNQPDFPGLIFETPKGPPTSKGAEGAKAYHPGQIHQRIPGKLYYLVLLDTAASIEEPAMKDFDFFLDNLIVE